MRVTVSVVCCCPHGFTFTWWDVAVCVKDTNQPSLPTPFYSALVSVSLSMALSTVFHSVISPNNSLLSHTVLPVFFCLIGPFNCISLCESFLQS